MNYSQNNEQEYILKFFAGQSGTLLDIGANDGFTNSNSRALLELGWGGALVEPNAYAFGQLSQSHLQGSIVLNYAITGYDGIVNFYTPQDSQLGTTKEDWRKFHEKEGKVFTSVEVECMSVESLIESTKEDFTHFDFITIDAEGCDFMILKQFPNDFCGAKMISIECSLQEREQIKNYLKHRGFTVYHTTSENLIMTK